MILKDTRSTVPLTESSMMPIKLPMEMGIPPSLNRMNKTDNLQDGIKLTEKQDGII